MGPEFRGCMCCESDSSLDISGINIIDYSSDDSLPALQSRSPSPRPSLQNEIFWISAEQISHNRNMMSFIESEKELLLETKFAQLCSLYDAFNS